MLHVLMHNINSKPIMEEQISSCVRLKEKCKWDIYNIISYLLDDKTHRSAGKGEKKKMFLIRMLLGNAYLCNESENPHKFCRPPCTTCHMDNCTTYSHVNKCLDKFDSVVGDNDKLFREFVVFDNDQCYPEYLITYERR